MRPFSVELSKHPFPPHTFPPLGHVAVTWRDSVIVWGGGYTIPNEMTKAKIPTDIVYMSVAGGDWVSTKTSGEKKSPFLQERMSSMIRCSS